MGYPGLTYALERIAIRGNVHGASAVTIQGYNGAVTTSAETLWDESSDYAFLTAAMSTPYVASSSANDTSAGTGARTVRVTGVNTSFATFTEDVTMNGQTSVNLVTANVLAIHEIEVLTAGSGLVNAGVIRVGTGTNTGGVPAVVHGHCAISANKSRHGFYVVPDDKILAICAMRFHSGSATAGAITASIEQAVGLTGLVKQVFTQMGTNNMDIKPDLKIPLVFDEQSKLNFQLISSAGTGPASVYAQGILIDKSANDWSGWI